MVVVANLVNWLHQNRKLLHCAWLERNINSLRACDAQSYGAHGNKTGGVTNDTNYAKVEAKSFKTWWKILLFSIQQNLFPALNPALSQATSAKFRSADSKYLVPSALLHQHVACRSFNIRVFSQNFRQCLHLEAWFSESTWEALFAPRSAHY